MARSVITVDIDASAIRVLEVQGRRVERWAKAPLEPDLLADGAVQEPAALGAQVRHLMEAAGMKGRPVFASLSGLYSVTRLHAIPAGSGGETRAAVSELLRESVPGSDMTPQYQIIDANSLGQRVFIMASPPAMVEAQVSMLESAGLYPRALELKGMSLARAVDRREAIIANVEHASLDVLVVSQGVP